MLAGLESFGVLGVFDAVYGASAGAFNGAYFLAGQGAYGNAIYYENLSTKKFINIWRLFRRKRVVNLGYVLEKVLVQEKPLNWQAVLNSPIPLKVAVSSVGQLKARLLQGFTNREELFTALRASSEMPLLAGGPVEFKDDRFLDAGLFQGIPIYTALEDDCSHVLVLLTRPYGARRKSPNFWDRHVGARIMDRWKKGLGSCYLKMPRIYNETLSFLGAMEKSLERRPYVFSISLSKDYPPIGRLEKDPHRLRKAAEDGRMAVSLALREKMPFCPEIEGF
jgi:predicted patatin/cPLA2 family phospholipase